MHIFFLLSFISEAVLL